MAKKQSSSQQPTQKKKGPEFRMLTGWKKSCFYDHLEKLDKKDSQFRLNICSIVDDAKNWSQRVIEFFPQYTNHSERHFLNVLSYMSWMAAPSIQDWNELECGLAIMVAYVHDLGMVPTKPEERFLMAEVPHEEIPASEPHWRRRALAWETFRERDKYWKEWIQLPAEERAKPANQSLWKLARANFLRATHSDVSFTEGKSRIWEHLMKFQGQGDEKDKFFEFKSYNWLNGLVMLALSHNQDIDYVETELRKGQFDATYKNASEARLCGKEGGGGVHWPRIAWLLRLADIMDMDASRTPEIFRDTITDAESLIEWRKHLSIPESPKLVNNVLTYHIESSPNATVEGAIREMLCVHDDKDLRKPGWINIEIQKVFRAQKAYANHGREGIYLPDEVIAELKRDGYEYEDLTFRLDRKAVTGLLMGDALYGSHEYALRELIQNALDAMHLRDLRSQLWAIEKKKEIKDRNPFVRPVEQVGERDNMTVEIRWGKDEVTKVNFIEIRDTGVGMSKEVLLNFLTQVGQSFYTDSKYLEERRLFHDHGLISTPISQFGIGFLSVFMLAKSVEIKTRAAIWSDKPWKGIGYENWSAKINGPFCIMDLRVLDCDNETGPTAATGTWVKLWLNDDVDLAPFSWKSFQAELASYFYGKTKVKPAPKATSQPQTTPGAEKTLNVATAIAKSIVWPLHTVVLIPPVGQRAEIPDAFCTTGLEPRIRLDGDFHSQWLRDQVTKPCPYVDGSNHTFHWKDIDWKEENVEINKRTGSRVRISLPTKRDQLTFDSEDCVTGSMLSLTEEIILAHTPEKEPIWPLVLINGILVSDFESKDKYSKLLQHLKIVPAFGSQVWLDLRGPATLRLKADRHFITEEQKKETLVAINEVQDRWLEYWRFDKAWKCTAARDLERKVNPDVTRCWKPSLAHQSKGWKWPIFMTHALLDDAIDSHPSRPSDKKPRPYDVLEFKARDVLTFEHARLHRDDPSKGRLLTFFDHAYLDLLRELPYSADADLKSLWPTVRSLEPALEESIRNCSLPTPLRNQWENFRSAILFAECFEPKLSESFAGIGLGTVSPANHLGNCNLKGALHFCGEGTCEVLGDVDLIAPLTGIPLNNLGATCRKWKEDRRVRSLLMLPFYLGRVPPEWQGKQNKLKVLCGVDSIMLYVPSDTELYTDHIAPYKGSTFLWDLKMQTVIAASVLPSRDEMRMSGFTFIGP